MVKPNKCTSSKVIDLQITQENWNHQQSLITEQPYHKPLMIYFNIDLRVQAVQSMLRAMELQKPKDPASRPTWILSKILTYLENLDTTPIVQSMTKTAFLLLLANGWESAHLS